MTASFVPTDCASIFLSAIVLIRRRFLSRPVMRFSLKYYCKDRYGLDQSAYHAKRADAPDHFVSNISSQVVASLLRRSYAVIPALPDAPVGSAYTSSGGDGGVRLDRQGEHAFGAGCRASRERLGRAQDLGGVAVIVIEIELAVDHTAAGMRFDEDRTCTATRLPRWNSSTVRAVNELAESTERDAFRNPASAIDVFQRLHNCCMLGTQGEPRAFFDVAGSLLSL